MQADESNPISLLRGFCVWVQCCPYSYKFGLQGYVKTRTAWAGPRGTSVCSSKPPPASVSLSPWFCFYLSRFWPCLLPPLNLLLSCCFGVVSLLDSLLLGFVLWRVLSLLVKVYRSEDLSWDIAFLGWFGLICLEMDRFWLSERILKLSYLFNCAFLYVLEIWAAFLTISFAWKRVLHNFALGFQIWRNMIINSFFFLIYKCEVWYDFSILRGSILLCCLAL